MKTPDQESLGEAMREGEPKEKEFCLPVEVVLVEDNPYDAELTLRALRGHHLANRIHLLKDGQEALDFLLCEGAYSHRKSEPLPRLVLLDIKLPKIDGTEVLRILKSRPETRTIPVVILTSSSEEKDLLSSYDLGVNSYIVKPVEFDAFMETVSRAGLYWILTNRVPSLTPETGNDPPGSRESMKSGGDESCSGSKAP